MSRAVTVLLLSCCCSVPALPVGAQKVPDDAAVPQSPPFSSAGCPARQILVSFDDIERFRGPFREFTGNELVTMHSCDAGGDFSTAFMRGMGSLQGLGGRWDRSRIDFQFGHRSSNSWGNIVCTVSAESKGGRDYEGRMSCNATGGRRGDASGATFVRVRL